METAVVAILNHHRNVNKNRGKPNKKKLIYKETWAPKDHNHHHSGGNRRHFPAANPSPPPRVCSLSVGDVEEKLKMAKEEIRVLRDKIVLQHRESIEAMDFQERFFKDQIKSILAGTRVDDDDDHIGKDEVEENAAICISGSSSVPEPEPVGISAH